MCPCARLSPPPTHTHTCTPHPPHTHTMHVIMIRVIHPKTLGDVLICTPHRPALTTANLHCLPYSHVLPHPDFLVMPCLHCPTLPGLLYVAASHRGGQYGAVDITGREGSPAPYCIM